LKLLCLWNALFSTVVIRHARSPKVREQPAVIIGINHSAGTVDVQTETGEILTDLLAWTWDNRDQDGVWWHWPGWKPANPEAFEPTHPPPKGKP
jgi:hypothetical protein